jgi:hypothetical protein
MDHLSRPQQRRRRIVAKILRGVKPALASVLYNVRVDGSAASGCEPAVRSNALFGVRTLSMFAVRAWSSGCLELLPQIEQIEAAPLFHQSAAFDANDRGE